MNSLRKTDGDRQTRVLLLAYRVDREFSMESRLAWFRACQCAEQFNTTVICAQSNLSSKSDSKEDVSAFRIVQIPHRWIERCLTKLPGGFSLAYRLWHGRVYRQVQKLHAADPFSLVHQVSYCGFREPGDCWRLGVPFVWGPVGGTQNFPTRFLGTLEWSGAIKELFRNIVNTCQKRLSRRVRRALSLATVFAANQEVRDELHIMGGESPRVQLETGVTVGVEPTPAQRDPTKPLRILWSGRLESWKGLPLLFDALSELPRHVNFELRVVGAGRCERRWRRLANRLGIDDRVQWVGWPGYELRMPHYRWADVFVFTSLRDTSGTGLLESLACGVPIVGLNHQGARDIMTKDCAVRIPVGSPKQVVQDIRCAVESLAADSKRLHSMSQSATERAKFFDWNRLGHVMNATYFDLLGMTPSPPDVGEVFSNTDAQLVNRAGGACNLVGQNS